MGDSALILDSLAISLTRRCSVLPTDLLPNRTDQEGTIGTKLCRRGTLEEVIKFLVRQVLNSDFLIDVIPDDGDGDVRVHKENASVMGTFTCKSQYLIHRTVYELVSVLLDAKMHLSTRVRHLFYGRRIVLQDELRTSRQAHSETASQYAFRLCLPMSVSSNAE